MKTMKLTKTILLLLSLIALFGLSACHEQQLPDDGGDDAVDCEKNPEHESCKEDDYPYSLGFTIYELSDSNGNIIDGYAVGNYKGEDTEVIVPAVWKDKPVIKIVDGTFENNTKITKVTVPASVQVMGKNVFSKCTSLTEVVFENGSLLQEIPVNTFYECTSLKTINIPSSVKKIGEYAFYYCSSINELVVPISVESIGRAAFGAMTSLNKISLPFIGGGKVDSTESNVFGYVFNNVYTEFSTPISQKLSATNIKTYYVPNSLKTVEILAGKTDSLEYGALSGVNSVETLILPTTINNFEENAFDDKTGIVNVCYRGTATEWISITGRYIEGNLDFLGKFGEESEDIVYNYSE